MKIRCFQILYDNRPKAYCKQRSVFFMSTVNGCLQRQRRLKQNDKVPQQAQTEVNVCFPSQAARNRNGAKLERDQIVVTTDQAKI